MRGGGYVDDEGTTRTDTDDMNGFRSHVVNLRVYLALGATPCVGGTYQTVLEKKPKYYTFNLNHLAIT